MSEQQNTLTYEGILELFRETREQFRETSEQFRETKEILQRVSLQQEETDRKFQETAEQMKRTDKKISDLGSRIGEIIENMVGGGNIIDQFRALGHNIIAYSRNKHFGRGTDLSGEIDLLLEDGDVAILVEVKTTLKNDDILDHIEQMENYRSWIDANGSEKKRYIGAVAGAVVEDNVIKFAQKKGFYVIVQSGMAFEIVPPPAGFVAKEW
jgi:hypothetical protein